MFRWNAGCVSPGLLQSNKKTTIKLDMALKLIEYTISRAEYLYTLVTLPILGILHSLLSSYSDKPLKYLVILA